MVVLPIACLKDNFAYLLYEAVSGDAVVIDPSEAGPVMVELARLELRLSAVLLTHHHWDHVGGVPQLRERFASIPIYAHEVDAQRIEGVTRKLGSGESLETSVGTIETLAVPGHTLGAVTYRWGDAAFTGDTLFGAGCGRLFEGTAAQMHASLESLAALPGGTRVFSGHEYTLQNLAFAKYLEPESPFVDARIGQESEKRKVGRPTVPSTIELERLTNPFLRCDEVAIRHRLGIDVNASSSQVFSAMRTLKDNFRA